MIQRSFSSGEVDPALYGRADVDRWKAALKQCKNWVVQPEGGIVVRQGFELKARIPYLYDATRLIPFEFGPSDSYVLVSYDYNFAVIDDGALVYGDIVRSGTINRATTPWGVSVTAHGYVTGDQVKALSGLNAGTTWVITYVDANNFTLNGTVATAGSSTEYVRRTVLASGTPPLAIYSDALKLYWNAKFIQSGDTLFFARGFTDIPWKMVRENYDNTTPRSLSFLISDIAGYPDPAYATPAALAGTAGATTVEYAFTATDSSDIETGMIFMSTVAGTAYSGTVTGTTLWTVTTGAAHGLTTNDEIVMRLDALLADGTAVYTDRQYVRVNVTGATTFTIPGAVSGPVGATIYWFRASVSSNALVQPTTAAPITITLPPIATTTKAYKQINVFRKFGRGFGYIGSTSAATFIDNGIIPDTKDTPARGVPPWKDSAYYSVYDHPGAVGLFQQRLMFGGFGRDVERIVGSHVGNYTTYDPGAEDASGLDFGLSGRTVSGIKHLVEIAGRAVVLTDTSEWVLRGGTNGGLTPTAINARADSYYGCGDQAPAVIGSSLIYVQRGDRIVREAKYDFSQEALASADLTLWAKHLFTPEVKRLAYQRTSQILWVLRNDGKLLGMTYIPEQNIWGWHQHEIVGRDISDICVVSEDGVDRLYIMCTSGGYIEVGRLPLAWESGDVDDHIGFDMALTFDGTLTGTGTLTGGTNWTTDETLTLTSSISHFVVGDVGKVFLLRLGDDAVYVTCTAYTSGTEVDVTPDTIVPVALRGVASESIARCAQTFSGLDHLEGETVGVIADGSREPDEVVTGGAITLDGWFARAQAGIIITADAKTLDMEPDEKDTYLGDFKHVTRVYLRVKDTRGLTVGLDADHLEPFMPQYTEDMLVNANPALQSGPVEVLMDATHEELGSVLMRQDTGLPATILNARPVFNAGELK